MNIGFPTLLQISYRSIWSSRLRTIITISIIALGIMALVGINIVVDSIRSSISSNFSSMGAGTFRIDAEQEIKLSNTRSFTEVKDPIKKQEYLRFEDLYNLPGEISVYYWSKNGVKASLGQEETNPNISLLATDDNYIDAGGLGIAYGRNFSPSECRSGTNVCILGNGIAKALTDLSPAAIDTMILLDGLAYKVIGVLKEKGSAMRNSMDNSVLITLQNSQRNYPSVTPSYYILVKSAQNVPETMAEDEATGKMRQARNLTPQEASNFNINTNEDLQKSMDENLNYVSLAAIFIGVITLISAAVSLMNIMLVSVSERTREIGLQKAIGATSSNIRNQLLTESLLISLLGGFLGILMGILIAMILSTALGTEFNIPWFWIVLGLVVCLLVGIIAGIYPAYKASKLRPIEALRYE